MTINIYHFSQSLKVINLRTWSLGSGLGFLIKLKLSEGLTGAETSTSKGTHSLGGHTDIGCWLETSIPLHVGLLAGQLSILKIWQVFSTRANSPRDSKSDRSYSIYVLNSHEKVGEFICYVEAKKG